MITERSNSHIVTTEHILDSLLGSVENAAVRLWDGQVWGSSTPEVTLVLQHPGALRELLRGSDLAIAEAYLYNDIDIEGNIEAIYSLADVLVHKLRFTSKLGLARDLTKLPKGHASDGHLRSQFRRGPAKLKGRPHSIERDRMAVRYHYDVSNDFYCQFLDQRLIYSCAYFNTPEDSLDDAQTAKLDLICRKLRLRPGEKLLDLGCGWGGLILYAAQNYGVDATGITLSEPQASLANERIALAGMSDHCHALVADYRELNDLEAYDKIASVGMFEHVGEALLPEYFSRAYRLLKPGGVFLNHGIALGLVDPIHVSEGSIRLKVRPGPGTGDSFMNKYVFPDGELVPINTSLRTAEEAGFEVRDVECLREHYLLTLRDWVRRLENNHERALQFVDESIYRVWRLYMSGCAYMFKTRRMNLYQSLLLKTRANGSHDLPLRRADWYKV